MTALIVALVVVYVLAGTSCATWATSDYWPARGAWVNWALTALVWPVLAVVVLASAARTLGRRRA